MIPFIKALVFLIDTAASMLSFIVLTRIVLQWVGLSFLHPMSQFVYRFTEPVLRWVRKVIPRHRYFDFPSMVLFISISYLKFLLVALLTLGRMPSFVGLFCLGLGDMGTNISNFYFYSLLIVILASWISSHTPSVFVEALEIMVRPVLKVFYKISPKIGGFDLSPYFVLVSIKLIDILLISPLMQFGFLAG